MSEESRVNVGSQAEPVPNCATKFATDAEVIVPPSGQTSTMLSAGPTGVLPPIGGVVTGGVVTGGVVTGGVVAGGVVTGGGVVAGDSGGTVMGAGLLLQVTV
jgi:hypothetical protein